MPDESTVQVPLGLVFDVQRFCVRDGPGIRTTVFLKGCPLCCAWCHNPEGIAALPELMITAGRCIQCGACVEVCPLGHPVEAFDGRGAPREVCLACGACAEACPAEARQIAGRWMSVAELLGELERDRVFYEESGGGVTFSGGEPLRQAAFLRHALDACREAGLHTALDTCGLAPAGELVAIAERTDLVLFDLKLVDEARHRRWTGVSNAQILGNLRLLVERGTPLWLRLPIIPGVNDDDASLEATLRLASSFGAVRQVCLLPYHRLGADKGRRLPGALEPSRFAPPADDRLAEIAGRFRAAGLTTRIGG